MSENITINDLSVELLLQIFQYCDIKCLCRLRQSCKRFNLVINSYKINVAEQNALVTNQVKDTIRNRSFHILSRYEKWRISHNWKIGRYKSIKLLKQRTKYMPWTHLDKNCFWVSQGKHLKAYRRLNYNKLYEDSVVYSISSNCNEDIVRFQIKDKYVICGLRNGGIWIYSLDENEIVYENLHSHFNDVTDVDLTNNIFVSGSSDKTFSVWPRTFERNTQLISLHTEMMYDKIWSLEVSPLGKNVAIGTSGFNSVPPFHVYDLERFYSHDICSHTEINGSGILDVHWENENIIMGCGYDTYLRKMDLRTGGCVQIWEDPHDSALYCIASDDLYTILVGTISYGRVVLWDQRVHNKYIQLYYTNNTSCLNTNSPVYSVAFDSTQLFTALDRCVACLDFSIYRGKVRNYEYDYFSLF